MMGSLLTYLLYFLAFYMGTTTSLFALSLPIPQAGFYARCLSSYLSLLICTIYGVIASIVLRLCGYGRVSQWAAGRSFKWVMRLTTGVQFEIEGQEHLKTRPAVFIANHQTELDVLLLGTIFPPYCSVTAKKSLKRIPFLGWFMALSGSVFIDRANRATAMAAFDGAAEEMRRDRQSVFIFPEGTRSYYDEPGLLPFKKGAFHLAVKAGVPVVPVVAANYSDVLSVRRKVFKAGKIAVKVLPPIATTNLTAADVEDLTKRTREIMQEELVKLTERTRGQKILTSSSNLPQADGASKASSVEYGRKNVVGKVRQEL